MSLNPQPRLSNDCINEMASEHCQSKPVVQHTEDEPKSDSISHESRLSIYFTVDSAGVVLAVNPVGAAGLGYTVEELIEQSIFSFFHGEDRAKLQVEFAAFVQHPAQVLEEKFRLRSKDGHSLLVKITAQALQSTAANTVFLLTSESITEYQAVEIATQECQSCHGLKIDDLAQQVKDWRSRVATLLQHIDSTVAMQGVSESSHEQQELLTDASKELSIGLEEMLVVQELLSQHNEERLQLHDITQGKPIEQEQTKYRQHLEELVREHTAELQRANEQLQQEITERKQAEEAVQQQILRERLVGAIAQSIHQSLNLEDILNTTVTQVRQFLAADRVLLYGIWPNGTGSAVTEAVVADYPPVLGQTFSEEVFPLESQQLYRQGRILAIDDIKQAQVPPCLAEFVQQFGVKAKLVVPVLHGEQLWGLLIAHQCSSPRQWQPFEIDLLKQLATQVAIAIQQSELYQKTQHQALREQTLNRVIQAIRQSLDLKSIFSTATFEIANLLQADRAEIMQYLPERKLWLNVADYRQNVELSSALGLEIPDEGNKIAAKLKRLEVVRIDDVNTCKDKINRRLAQMFPGARLLVPLHIGSLVWGSLGLVRDRQPFSWQDSEVELTCAVANQLAIAIQQSELFRQVQRLNVDLERKVQVRTAQLQLAFEFEATLKRITDRVRDSLDEHQILQTAVQALTIAIGVKCCNAALYNLDQGISTICYEYTTSVSPALGQVVRMETLPEIYTQLLQGQCFQFCPVFDNSVQSPVAKLVCPIFDDHGVIGDLWLSNHQYYAFAEQDIRLVQQVANQCAIAIRQARLYQATHAQVEELEKLNRLKDDFLSTVSHELRTPVCNIKMAAQMLEIVLNQAGIFDAYPNTTARYFQILQDECDREISLINNLLDLSRLEAGTEPLMLTTIEPKMWILSIVEAFIERAETQQQQIQIDIPSDLPALTTDLSDLERILTEVLNNACKYTPPGGTITVSAQATAEFLQLCVSNSGTEIPESELNHIFDKFYRIPNNDPWKHGGTGLGLALVKKLVEHLKGTIDVNSSNSQITFTLQFPLN